VVNYCHDANSRALAPVSTRPGGHSVNADYTTGPECHQPCGPAPIFALHASA
jgi:hypothetical protein